jgi:outer membrane receptor protein involved in Fe transport
MNRVPFKRTRFFAACAGVVGVSMLPGYVAAQGMLEEVVVTAQKREQNLQDVPISVVSFSGDALAESGIKDVFDLQSIAPGLKLSQSQSASTSNFSIRGIGTGSNNFGFESSVGLYIDGVYRSRQSSMINQLVDIQSVDILRGPQGTLFGRNTLSGAVQFTTIKPDHDGSGFGEVTVGNYGLLNLSGAVSISAIEDELAFRLTGFSSERDGYVENIALPGSDDINDRDRYGFRAQALWTPTEELSVLVIADYADVDESCCGAAVLADNNRLDGRDANKVIGADTASPLQLPLLGQPGADTYKEANGTVFISEDRVFDDVVAQTKNPISLSEDQGLSVQVDWNAEEYTWTSITAYRSFDSFDNIDADFSDFDALSEERDAEQESFSQELRLAYVGESLSYVVGANYFQQTLDSDTTLTFGPEADQLIGVNAGLGNFNGFPIALANAILKANFDTSGFLPVGGTALESNEQEHQSWAVFGQIDYDLMDDLVVTAGLRYSDEDKKLNANYSDSGGNFLGFNKLGGFARSARRDNITSDSPAGQFEDSQVTGTLKLSWFVNDDIMFYGSYGTGYKAGGTNTDRIDSTAQQTFDAETSKSLELGMKAEFPDQAVRLNVAIYTTELEDFQVGTFDGANFNVQNAATVDTYGGEIELLWQATESLTVTSAYAKNVSEFDKFPTGNCASTSSFQGVPNANANITDTVNDPQGFIPDNCDQAGNRLGTSPEDTLSITARQEWSLSDSTYAYAKVEYAYTSDMLLNQNNDPLTKQDSFELVNLRLGLIFEDYQTEITLWGRNILDEDYLGTSAVTPVQDGSEIAYIRDPATFGLTINKKF